MTYLNPITDEVVKAMLETIGVATDRPAISTMADYEREEDLSRLYAEGIDAMKADQMKANIDSVEGILTLLSRFLAEMIARMPQGPAQDRLAAALGNIKHAERDLIAASELAGEWASHKSCQLVSARGQSIPRSKRKTNAMGRSEKCARSEMTNKETDND